MLSILIRFETTVTLTVIKNKRNVNYVDMTLATRHFLINLDYRHLQRYYARSHPMAEGT